MKNKTFVIKTSFNNNSKVQTLIFEGDLGINNATAIKKNIQSLKFRGDSVKIHLRHVEKIDITSIQVIRALRIVLNNMGKRSNIFSEIPEDIERLLNNSGFDKTL